MRLLMVLCLAAASCAAPGPTPECEPGDNRFFCSRDAELERRQRVEETREP